MTIFDEIEGIKSQVEELLASNPSLDELRNARVLYLGKKGSLTGLLKRLGTLPPEERKETGSVINTAKDEVEAVLEGRISFLEQQAIDEAERLDFVDVTQPSKGHAFGGVHPVVQVTFDVIQVLQGLGFSIALGPEIEDDFYNFEALNLPPHHPARDAQDTFYFDDGLLLRTHTSPVQIRSMLKYGAPLRIACPGRVYRRDSDPTHSPMFHQVEGLVVDEDISIGDLKGCLEAMVSAVFDKPLAARYRTSYFPFTEPSMEVDIECIACSGKNPGCRICKGTGWLEIGGMGMVHPNVLRAGGIDPERYSGFAWGMGLDRIAMLKYNLNDLRVLFDGDISYLLSGRRG